MSLDDVRIFRIDINGMCLEIGISMNYSTLGQSILISKGSHYVWTTPDDGHQLINFVLASEWINQFWCSDGVFWF